MIRRIGTSCVLCGWASRVRPRSSGLGDRAAARTPCAGRAAVAVIARDNHPGMKVGEAYGVEVADMPNRSLIDRQFQHLIEVAIVESPIPADRQGVTAHHPGCSCRIEGCGKPGHIAFVVPALD